MDQEIKDITRSSKVLYISTYVPRKCGIATFTKDLVNAVNLLNPKSLAQIAAMDNEESKNIDYPHEVKFRIRQNVPEDYARVIDYVNTTDEFEIVVVEHEFGIYGGPFGQLLLTSLERLEKPLIATLHTVLEKPPIEMKKALQALIHKCRYAVVMLELAKTILKDVYEINENKIVVIPHGVPDFPLMETEELKKKLNLENFTTMSSINLLSESKGIAYVIEALPGIVKQIPNFLYLVIGETHPMIKIKFGEAYRESLIKRAEELGVSEHVKFVNKYVSLNELVKYVGASDFYITPYLDPQQTASGSLAYAIGAGKACISTPYIYAKEMLGENRGVLVPFKDSNSIIQAVVSLNTDSKKRSECQVKAYDLGRMMNWHNIGHQYFHLFHHV